MLLFFTIPSSKLIPTIPPSSPPPQHLKLPHLFGTTLYPNSRKPLTLVLCKADDEQQHHQEKQELRGSEEWLKKLPEKSKPLYSHSLPCIEAWLKSLEFHQSEDDRAVWFVEKPDWHAHLSLDVTDIYVRYLKSGPGNLEKDVERRFSYALSREDIENAVLGGP